MNLIWKVFSFASVSVGSSAQVPSRWWALNLSDGYFYPPLSSAATVLVAHLVLHYILDLSKWNKSATQQLCIGGKFFMEYVAFLTPAPLLNQDDTVNAVNFAGLIFRVWQHKTIFVGC